MYSFLFYANKEPLPNPACFRKACDITLSLMPDLGCNILVHQKDIPEINGGWFYLYPQEVPDRHLITTFSDEQIAVLVFGELTLTGPETTASIVAQTWKQGNVEAVRKLDGCFSAVIVDLHTQEIFLISDLLGLRTFTYYHNDKTLLVSIHEVPIVATGLCPINYNLVSAASIVACDWSLQGRPMLKDLSTCDPNTFVEWKEGSIRRHYKPLIPPEQRIEKKDSVRVRQQIDQIIEKMRENARVFCGDSPAVEVQLTCGMDTRAVTALLLSVLDSSQIESITQGERDNFEVKMARRLAKKYNFRQKDYVTKNLGAEDFIAYADLIAFVTNGTANSKSASKKLPKLAIDRLPTFVGNGGELHQGFFYPSPLRKPKLDNYTNKDIEGYLLKKFPRINALKWFSEEIGESLKLRLSKIIETFRLVSTHPADIFNLFYAYERYCRWGSRPLRSTWSRNRYSLFDSPALVRMAFELPAPISHNCLLHRTIIKRFMPRSYFWLINKKKFMPLYDYPRLSKAFAEGMIRLNKVSGILLRKIGGGASGKSHEQLRGDIFAQQLSDVIRQEILSRNSFSRDLLRKNYLEDIVESHLSRKQDNVHVIGFLVTLERYRKLIGQVYKMAHKGTEKQPPTCIIIQ